MSKYRADSWVILEITHLEETYHKVFVTLLDRDGWRINSGIDYVKKEVGYNPNHYDSSNPTTTYKVFGHSGSEYHLERRRYGTKGTYNKSVLSDILEKATSAGYKIKKLEEDESYEVLEKYLR